MRVDRVVPVIRFVDGQRRVGSGYRISGEFVLTAAHCVQGTGLRVWLVDGERAARVVADGAPDIDLALLKVVVAPGEPPVAGVPLTRCARVDRSIPGRIAGCTAVGYPENAVRPEAPFTTSEVDGWIPTGSGLADSAEGRRTGFLTLRAEGTPPRPLPTRETDLGMSVWAGMSGAAVFAGDLLVGVVAEHHLPEGDGSLTVVPIEWACQLPDPGRAALMQALGFDSVAGLHLLTALPAAPDPNLISSGIVTHAEELNSLSGLRRNLRSDCLPFVPPGPGEPHPDYLFSRLSELAGTSGILLVGAAGTGKTRTCFEVAGRAVTAGWSVLHVKIGEPPVTNKQLELAVDQADGDHVLVIIDYLNECRGLNLLALRDWIPHAKAGGKRVTLLACARPGWLATTDAPLSPLFRTVHLRPDADQSARIRDEIIMSLAPGALAILGRPQFVRLCGLRPVIAMLIALEAEAQAARGHLARVLPDVRPEELIDWLNRRLSEDGLVPQNPPDLLSDTEPELNVQVIAAMMAAAPQHAASLVDCGAATHDGNAERADHLVGVLISMGWMISDATGISIVHDIVTDHVLERTLLRAASGTVRTAVANRILSSCLGRARTIGRYATNLGRVIRDLEAESQVTQPGRKLRQFCATWLTEQAADVGAVLVRQGDEGAYALGAVMENPAWSPVAFQKWSAVVVPWLSRYGKSLSARHLLYKGLAIVDAANAGDLILEATRWLDAHGTVLEAGFVLGPLLERELDAGAAGAAVSRALAWLDAHGTTLDARFVLHSLLERELDAGAAGSAVTRALAWLDAHGTILEAQFVLGPLLERELDAGAAGSAVTCALAWLDAHGTTQDAGFVLRPLLERELDAGAAGSAVTRALAWLDAHGTTQDAQFVLGPLLERELDAGAAGAAVTCALAWLDAHGTTLEAQFVLGPLVAHKGINGLQAVILEDVDRWLEVHPSEAVYISKYLARQKLFTQRIAAAIIGWAKANPGDEDIGWRLSGLARKIDHYPALSSGLLDAVEYSFRALPSDVNGLNAHSEVDGLLENLARARSMYCGLAAARLDDLIIAWLSRPEALTTNCSKDTYFTGLTSRIISLMYVGRFEVEEATLLLDRMRIWIGNWQCPRDEVMREGSLLLVVRSEEFFRDVE